MVKRINKSPSEVILELSRQPKYKVELMGIYAYMLACAEDRRTWGIDRKGDDIAKELNIGKPKFSECLQILQELEIIEYRRLESSGKKKPFYKLLHVGPGDVLVTMKQIKETGEIPDSSPFNYGDGIFVVVLQPMDFPVDRATKNNKFEDPNWFKQLEEMDIYKGINIQEEKHACEVWCVERNYTPTGQRFINWLKNAKRFREIGMDKGNKRVSRQIGDMDFDGML